jgi:hypothetical protein
MSLLLLLLLNTTLVPCCFVQYGAHLQYHLPYALLNVAGLVPNWNFSDTGQVDQRHSPAGV